jgi:hypothetical protein
MGGPETPSQERAGAARTLYGWDPLTRLILTARQIAAAEAWRAAVETPEWAAQAGLARARLREIETAAATAVGHLGLINARLVVLEYRSLSNVARLHGESRRRVEKHVFCALGTIGYVLQKECLDSGSR